MPRRRDESEDEIEDGEYEDGEDQLIDDGEEEEDYEQGKKRGKNSSRKRGRSSFIDDAAEEDDEEDDEDEGGGGGGRSKKRKSRKKAESLFEIEAAVNSEEDEDEEDGEDDDFIDYGGADLPEEDDGGRGYRRPLFPRVDDNEDEDEILRRVQQRYSRTSYDEYDEETTDVDQQALLPSVRDTKFWRVKCATGREREMAVCLMQKCIDRGPELQITSVIARDNLENFIYIEAYKESHVREACKGLRNIFVSQQPQLVPMNEMTDVLTVESKAVDLARDTWVRIRTGIYKGDLAKVVDVDNVRKKVTVKLIPRIDLEAIASRLEGREAGGNKKGCAPRPRFMNLEEARDLNIRVEGTRDRVTGNYFEKMDEKLFKDGFLYKSMSMRSITAANIKPSFDELEIFRKPGEHGDDEMISLSTLFANRKKGHYLKGDTVIVVNGDLKNLKGWVEKVEADSVHIRPEGKGLPKTLAVHAKELRKYFEPGIHVKVVSGTREGATGMVVKVDRHVLVILSDTAKEHIHVFADDVVESSEVATGVTKIGDYELHDLVELDNTSFGVIIRVECEAFKVLKGVPERAEVSLVRLREIKRKIERKSIARDRRGNTISVKDVVKVSDGPCKGKQGLVEHIHKGILFIHDRHHLEHAGFICAKSLACDLVGGSRSTGDRNVNEYSSFAILNNTPRIPPSPRRFERGRPPFQSIGRNRGGRGGYQDALIGTTIKIRRGPFKGERGRVKGIKGQSVRVELEAQMKVVTVDRNDISENVAVTIPCSDSSRYGMGSETPMHPSRTPLHPYMTPMRDAAATPHHDGMRTPMRDRAWNPYASMTPQRDNWEDGNPGSWGTTQPYQAGSPPSRAAYEAPTPVEAGTPRDSRRSSAYANAPSPSLPSSPVLEDDQGASLMPEILVNVNTRYESGAVGVVREVHPDGMCKVRLVSGSGETVTAMVSELGIVPARKADKVKVIGGAHRGSTGKLLGVDGKDGIVRLEDTSSNVILEMAILAKACSVA